MRQVDQERPLRFEDVSPDAFRDTSLRRFCERLLTIEDRRNRNRPVDALRRGAVRLRALRAMRRFRPGDRAPITPSDDEESLARGRRAVVGSVEDAPLDDVSERFELRDELAERLAGVRLDRLAGIIERTPRHELGNVLEADDPRRHGLRPSDRDPGEPADFLRSRLATFRPREVRAVRRQVQPADSAAARRFDRIHFEDVFVMVLGLRMIRRVHHDRVFVVIDRDGRRNTGCPLKPFGPSAAASKEIDADLARTERGRRESENAEL
jgi:hypothetical protein